MNLLQILHEAGAQLDREETGYLAGFDTVKSAGDAQSVYALAGRLYLSDSGWLLLNVPNAVLHGLFDALDVVGLEKPTRNTDDPEAQINAHISVMSAAETEQIGRNLISERGHNFHYQLGSVKSVKPDGWDGVSKVYFVEVFSPELRNLRKSYGLSPLPTAKDGGEKPFHITLGLVRTGVLHPNEKSKAAASAPGIPSRSNLGDLSKLKQGLIDLVIQRHLAEKAGPHYDVRFGTPETGLYSWATKHELPGPGERRALFQQPVHLHEYGDFEGTIEKGYGKGTVTTHRKGKVLVTSVEPNKIEFTTADKKYPERFVLLRPTTWGEKDWLLINRTPADKSVPYEKVRYKKIPSDQVDPLIARMQQGETIERKIDGASSLIRLLKDGVEMMSYRTGANNRPILYTEKFFGGPGKVPLPKELIGTVLKGELYGQRDGKMLGPHELGGLLNSTLGESLRKQQEQGINLRNMVYDISQLGDKPVDWHQTPRMERRKMIEQVLQHLPADKFHLSEAATTPEEAKKLWSGISQAGYGPDTEGIVYWPQHGTPVKSKLMEDQDVYITGTFPGEGKYQGSGVGGFTYATEPGGKTVGRLGTGLDDEMRRDAFADPQSYVGRVARIRAQQQFPSGAWRVPALVALHEDYPSAPAQKEAGVPAASEYCAGCGASFEKSEEGYCNSCGRDYDTGKIPEKGRYHEGKRADLLPGGKGDDLQPADVDSEELAKGRKHEQEHTGRNDVATEIALDHLAEDDHYYEKLEEIEKASVLKEPFYGEHADIQPGPLEYVVTQHDAKRRGPHKDLRIGNEKGLFSWATRHSLPGPGSKTLMTQTPMHSYREIDFEGEIPEGRGAGTMKKLQRGQLQITKAGPEGIHFTFPSGQRYALIRPNNWQGRDWLLMNLGAADEQADPAAGLPAKSAEAVPAGVLCVRDGWHNDLQHVLDLWRSLR